MRVKLHQDVEGKKAGETVDVPEKRAKWLVAEGYASTSKDADGVRATTVPADQDPRLAENREKPDPTLRERMAAGLGTPGSVKADDSEITPKPFVPDANAANELKLTNGEGDVEAAEKGKEKLEEAAVKTEVDDEKEAAKVEANRAANDKVEAEIQAEQVKEDVVSEDELKARHDLEAPRALGDLTPLSEPKKSE